VPWRLGEAAVDRSGGQLQVFGCSSAIVTDELSDFLQDVFEVNNGAVAVARLFL
jgi:hypothetical protein